MRRAGAAVASLLTILLATSAVRAQDAASAALYRQADEAYPTPTADRLLPVLVPAAQASARKRAACVPTGLEIVSVTPAGADQIVLRAVVARQARNGWIAKTRAVGCGAAPMIDFVVLERRFGLIDAGIFAYGDGLAWPSLAADTLIPAALTADRVLGAKACPDTQPLRTDGRIVSRETPQPPGWGVLFAGSWREEWIFSRCGRSAIVPIEFTADGNGGANYHIAAAEVRLAAAP